MKMQLLAERRAKPFLRFDYEDPTERDRNVGVGLSHYGPYDKKNRSFHSCDFGFVYPEKWKETADIFKKDFMDGYEWLTGGFSDFFRLDDVEISNHYPVPDTNLRAYREGVEDAVAGDHDLVIVLMSEMMKQLDVNSPYWFSKALLTNRGVPSQIVTKDVIENRQRFKNSIVNLASQIYAKLGGVPWVIHDPVESADLLIGTGWSQYGEKLGPKKRTIGFTTAYRDNGAYLWFYSTYETTDVEELDDALSDAIIESVEKYEREEGEEAKKIIIHSCKKVGRAERDAIEKLKEKRNDLSVVLSHLNMSHNLLIFDPTDASGASESGIIIQIGDDQCLVLTDGRDKGRGVFPSNMPVWIKTYPSGAEFEPVKKIGRSVYDLCYVFWKDQFGANKPITMKYSYDIAEMLEYMRRLEDKDVLSLGETPVHERLRDVPWFL